MPNLIVSAVSTFDNKGLKKGTKEISAFEKRVKSFAKVFAAAFSVRALTNYSKKAVQAFMADEKAAKSLEQQLKNTGYQFSAPGIEQYISNLQKTTGVLDDEIRPAFQKLLSVTGSITLSQDALATALNTSAAGYGSVVEVSQALAKGFAGETTALKRLVPGLDKAALKSGDMNKIMAQLNEKFTGQSAARLETYAGKMDLLTVASENAKEIIGKGLLDSLTLLSKDNSIQNAADDMELFAKKIADASYGMASLIKKLDKVTGLDKVSTDTLLFLANPLLYKLSEYGRTEQNKFKPLPENQKRSAGRISGFQFKQEEIARKKLVAALKAEEALKKLKDKYDLERIGLMAALNAATDQETKVRLAEKLAILDGNAAMRDKYLLDKINIEALENTIESTIILTNDFYALAKATQALLLAFGLSPSQIGPGGTIVNGAGGRMGNLADVAINNPNFGYSAESRALGLALGFTPSMSMASAPQEIRITVDTAAGGDRLSQAIAESIQVASRNGYSTVPAGQGF